MNDWMPMTYRTTYRLAMVTSLAALMTGCGAFGNINQNPNNYSNWVADYSTNGANTGATVVASSGIAPAPISTVEPMNPSANLPQTGQPLAANAPVAPATTISSAEPLVSEVIVEPIGAPTTTPVAPPARTDAPVTVIEPVSTTPIAAEPIAANPVPAEPIAAAPVSSAPDVLDSGASSARGNWQWPVDGGKIYRAFDPVKTGSKGALISGEIGAAVRAANKGNVVYVGRNLPGLGNLIIVSHDGGVASGYGHVGSISVKEGDSVKQGQKIAVLEGINVKEPVVHFEVRENNKALNPIDFVKVP